MSNSINLKIVEDIIKLRLEQMYINECYKNKEFKIPIHLAMGHEAIAVAVNEVMVDGDQLSLSHRNIHYNLLRAKSLKNILDEFNLKENGLGNAKLGSMNLTNKDKGVLYTSSILGNNLCVASGMALSQKVKDKDNVVFVVTGDGAMEEGAFYESIQFLKTYNLGAVVIVENNEWSLASRIEERRCAIDLRMFAASFDSEYIRLQGNDVFEYTNILNETRKKSVSKKCPVIVEVKMDTLGDWRLKTEDFPEGKYINYHAGPAPTVKLSEWPVIHEDSRDPLFVLTKYFTIESLQKIARESFTRLNKDLS